MEIIKSLNKLPIEKQNKLTQKFSNFSTSSQFYFQFVIIQWAEAQGLGL